MSEEQASQIAPPCFDPARISELLAGRDATFLQPFARKAADEFYGNLLDTINDYLLDNLDHNLTSHLHMLERENQRMRTELFEIGQIVGPHWGGHAGVLKRLREMDRALVDLTAIKRAVNASPQPKQEAR